jgi:hypothetical protein
MINRYFNEREDNIMEKTIKIKVNNKEKILDRNKRKEANRNYIKLVSFVSLGGF